MNKTPQEMLQEFSALAWLLECGKTSPHSGGTPVTSWRDAAKICKSRFHVNVQTCCRNMLTLELFRKVPDRFREWNRIVKPHDDKVTSLINKRVLKNERGFAVDAKTSIYIRVDVVMALMELEYADIVPPRHFAERAKWYLAGHFPCGWDGDFPEGRLFVY